MNLKKMLSVMAATAIGMTSLSLVSVSAEDIADAQVGTIYKAADMSSSLKDTEGNLQITETAAYESMGSPFGEVSSVTTEAYPSMVTDANVDTTFTYNITTEGSYTFSVLVAQFGGRHPDIIVDSNVVFNGQSGDVAILGNGQGEGSNGPSSRNYGIIQYTTDFTAGEHTIQLKMNTAANRVQGLLAAVLNQNEDSTAQSDDWTNLSGSSTASTVVDGEVEGEYIFTYPQRTTGSGFSYDLLSVMTNKPEDLSAVTTGKINVSYDLYLSDATAAASDFFIDLSGNQTIPGWGGGNAATYGRLSGYATYNDIKFIPGQLATNSGDIYNQDIRKKDQYVTVTYTVDLADGTFTGAYGDTTSTAMEGTATEKTNALYLNVQPSLSANSNNDIVMKIKNIKAEYIEDTPLQLVGSSENEGSDYAYGFTYTLKTEQDKKYTGCQWTVDYNDITKVAPSSDFETAVNGNGADIVVGIIITTGDKKADVDLFDIGATLIEE